VYVLPGNKEDLAEIQEFPSQKNHNKIPLYKPKNTTQEAEKRVSVL
jgi:hypothetical protein